MFHRDEAPQQASKPQRIETGRDSLGSRVGDDDEELVSLDGKQIIKVSADFHCGEKSGSDVELFPVREMGREETHLDFSSDFEFLGESFSSDPLLLDLFALLEQGVEGSVELLAELVDLKSHPVGLVACVGCSLGDPSHCRTEVSERFGNPLGDEPNDETSDSSNEEEENEEPVEIILEMELFDCADGNREKKRKISFANWEFYRKGVGLRFSA